MRTKQRRRVIGALLTSLVVGLASIHSACSSLPGSSATPEVQLTGLSLLDASGDIQRFRVSFEVSNPNAVAVPFEKLSFSVRLGGEGVLTGETVQTVTLPASGSETTGASTDDTSWRPAESSIGRG